MQASGYKMYADLYAQKEHPPQAVVIGTYDRLVGFSKAMQASAKRSIPKLKSK